MRSMILSYMLLSSLLVAGEPWTVCDKVLEGTVITSLAIDWGQTLHAQSRRYAEQNCLMGRHPSRATINQYFVACMVVHALIADQLHGRWRTAWQMTFISVEYHVTSRNFRLGSRIVF